MTQTPLSAPPSALPVTAPPPRLPVPPPTEAPHRIELSLPTRAGTLAERIRNLAVWVESELSPTRWYLADAEGMALHSAGTTETQVVTAVALARALRPLRGFLGTSQVGAAALELDGGRTLHTLWCDTSVGRVSMGLEDPKHMSQEILHGLRAAIRAALED
ncbi:MAG: hypothetical protein KC933_29455 [Myxococcales bacterium]|nr:hypothetical protein [Myxococcales bacterium]